MLVHAGRKLADNEWSLLGCDWKWIERLIGQRFSQLLRASQTAHTNTASRKALAAMQATVQQDRAGRSDSGDEEDSLLEASLLGGRASSHFE